MLNNVVGKAEALTTAAWTAAAAAWTAAAARKAVNANAWADATLTAA